MPDAKMNLARLAQKERKERTIVPPPPAATSSQPILLALGQALLRPWGFRAASSRGSASQPSSWHSQALLRPLKVVRAGRRPVNFFRPGKDGPAGARRRPHAYAHARIEAKNQNRVRPLYWG